MGMEFTNNQASSKRVLLPLEPDFSDMSDPSVIVEPPDNNWRSHNRQAQTSLCGIFPGGISLKVNINLRRGGDVDRLLHPPLQDLTLTREAEDQKDPKILTRREEDIHLLLPLLLYLIINHMIMANTKGVDIVRRLHRILVYYSLRK